MAKKKVTVKASGDGADAVERKPLPIPQHHLTLQELDGVLDAAVADKATNRRNFGANEAQYRQISIPLPSLCLQFLFGQTGWPMGRTIYLSGPPGGLKTSFMDDIMRWHLQTPGLGCIIDAERKDAPQRRESMFKPEVLSRARIEEVSSTEGWQNAISGQLKTWRNTLLGTKDKPGKGFVVPMFIGVDSIASVTTESQVADAMVDGHAKRGQFGAAALVGSEYMKIYTALAEDMPITLCLISHEKGEGQDRTVSGGKAPQFHCTYFVDMRRTQYLRTVEYGGVMVRIHIGKNSMSEGDREIYVRMIWYMRTDPETGLPVQETYFDWPTCTLLMLLAQRAGSVGAARQIDEIVDIHTVGEAKGKQKYWSKTLGIPEKKPVTPYEIGLMIDSNEAICRALCTVLKIHPHPYFIPGVDYRAQQDNAVKAGKQVLQSARSVMALPAKAQELVLEAAAEQLTYRDDITGEMSDTEAVAGRVASRRPARTATEGKPTLMKRSRAVGQAATPAPTPAAVPSPKPEVSATRRPARRGRKADDDGGI